MKTTKGKNTGKRICLLDTLRGIALVAMLVSHLLFDVAYLLEQQWAYEAFLWTQDWFMIFPCIFISVSGICAALGRNTAMRGAQLSLLGAGITLVTAVLMPDLLILCDVLSMLGFCMLVYAVLEKYLSRINWLVGLVLCLAMFLFTVEIEQGHLGIEGIFTLKLDSRLYQTDWLYPFGIHSNNFASANYYPIFPGIFLFLGASFAGRKIKNSKMPEFVYKNHVPPLAFMGRHSLIIYLVHQPLMYAVVWLIGSLKQLF